MSRRLAVVAVAWTLLVGLGPATPSRAAEPPKATAPDVEGLQREIAALRAEVAALRQERAEQAAAAVEERLAAIERRLDELASTVETMQEGLRETTDTASSLSDAEERRVRLSVYGTFNAIDPVGSDSVFDAEAFELVFSGRPHPRLGLFAEIEFEDAAAVGGERGGEVLIEQAYANYDVAPWLQLRAGVLLVPFGNFNVDHYAPVRDVISKPLLAVAVAPSDWTDNGIGLRGSTLLGSRSALSWDVAVLSGLDADITGLGALDARQAFGVDNNNDKVLAGRLALQAGGHFELGLSGYRGAYDDAGKLDTTGWAVDLGTRLGPFRLTGELDDIEAEQLAGPATSLRGWYVRGTLDFGRRLLHRGRHGELFPESRFQLVGQWERVELAGPIDGLREKNRESRWTAGLNYRPSDQWVLKIDYEKSEAPRRPLVVGSRRAWLGSIGFNF